jgi:hypothetical protein
MLLPSTLAHARGFGVTENSQPVQKKLLLEAVGSQGRVPLCFDGDQSGQAATQDALARLRQHVFVKLPDVSTH